MKTKYKTIRKTRVISNSQQIVRIDQERCFGSSDSEKVMKTFKKILKYFKLVVISDYGKGTVDDPSAFINLCREKNIPVLVDPKKKDLSSYKGSDVLTPNVKEFKEFVQYNHGLDLGKNISNLCNAFDIKIFVITMGPEGVIWGDKTGQIGKVSTNAQEVTDVTGAGDTFLAYFAKEYLSGKILEECIKLGNKAAGIVVGKKGTYSLTISEFDQDYSIKEETSSNKIFSASLRSDIKNLASQLKKQQKSIVFTNGCFDVFHVGHLDYLRKSSKLGDLLIVALNSDDSVKLLKGDNRPINNFYERASILAEFSFVDYIIEFDQETPIQLIKMFRPSILTKGDDYKKKAVVGSSFAKSYGGQVKLIKIIHHKSTTAIINS